MPSASGKSFRIGRKWLAAAVLAIAVLTISNLSSVRNPPKIFATVYRTVSTGYSASNPVAIGDRVVFTEMLDQKYAAMSWQNGEVRDIPFSGDVLSVGGNEAQLSRVFRTGDHTIFHCAAFARVFKSDSGAFIRRPAPHVSSDGRWLAFLREEHGRRTVWLMGPDSRGTAQLIGNGAPNILDISVTSEGDLIAAVGPVSEPHLAL